MKAKLIKENNGYTLFVDGKVFGDTDGHPLKSITNRLSLRNCQAIERGYDLDELAREGVKFHEQDEIHRPNSEHLYKKGFQKALELMGDKKFSEEDLEKSIIWAHDKSTEGVYLSRLPITDFIQSLQQTEWGVEIIEFTADDLKSINNEWHMLGELKLDADGCLILKRI